MPDTLPPESSSEREAKAKQADVPEAETLQTARDLVQANANETKELRQRIAVEHQNLTMIPDTPENADQRTKIQLLIVELERDLKLIALRGAKLVAQMQKLALEGAFIAPPIPAMEPSAKGAAEPELKLQTMIAAAPPPPREVRLTPREQDFLQRLQDELDDFNDASQSCTKSTGDALEAFDANPTPATYTHCGEALATEWNHIEAMSKFLPSVLSGEELTQAMKELNARATVLNEIAEANGKLWEQREVRAREVEKVTKRLQNAPLSECDGIVKSLRSMTEQWAKDDGATPTRFNRVIETAEAIIQERRNHEQMQKYANQYYSETIKGLEGFVKTTVLSREQNAKANSRSWYDYIPSMMILNAGLEYGSGTAQAQAANDKLDQERIKAATSALRSLESRRVELTDPNTNPVRRIDEISKIRSTALQADFSGIQKMSASAVAFLDTTDKCIREVAQWLPGGALGLAIADVRMHPNDPESYRSLMIGIGTAVIDLIPMPGLGVAARAGARAILRTGSRVAPRVVARVTARTSAAMIKRGSEEVIKGGLKRSVESDATHFSGVEAESKVNFSRAASTPIPGSIAESTVLSVTRSRHLAYFARRTTNNAIDKLTSAESKQEEENNRGPR